MVRSSACASSRSRACILWGASQQERTHCPEKRRTPNEPNETSHSQQPERHQRKLGVLLSVNTFSLIIVAAYILLCPLPLRMFWTGWEAGCTPSSDSRSPPRRSVLNHRGTSDSPPPRGMVLRALFKSSRKGQCQEIVIFQTHYSFFFNSTSNKWYIPLSWFILLSYAAIIVVDPLFLFQR